MYPHVSMSKHNHEKRECVDAYINIITIYFVFTNVYHVCLFAFIGSGDAIQSAFTKAKCCLIVMCSTFYENVPLDGCCHPEGVSERRDQ